jgi:signal transduction histidine kinase
MHAPTAESHPAFKLTAAVQELSLARDLERVVEIVRHAARDLTGADGATFVLRDQDMCHYVDEDAIGPLWKGRRFPLNSCVSGWVMQHGSPVAIEDIANDPRVPLDAYRATFVKSLALVPIRQSAPIGAIGNYWASPHRTSPMELQLLQALADTTSVALENIRVYSELEQRVRDRTAALEIANRDLDAFSYTISHDLRAPVRHVMGFADLLVATGGCNEKAMPYVDRIRGAATRMNGLIEDMLKLAKISVRPIHRIRVDLSALATEVVNGLAIADRPNARNVTIAPGLHAEGDPGLLRIVLENLLSNAWKFTGKVAAPRIAFDATTGTNPEFFVRDNGVGFAMNNSDRLFQPFGRLHAEADFPGNGIGLATARRVIQKHGGSIRAESTPGQGTTFYFTLR